MSGRGKSNEAFWWSLFSAGGVMAALFVPVLILVTGFLLPFRDTPYEQIHGTLASGSLLSWIVRLALLGVIALSLFHCGHRIRHILMDLGLRGAAMLLSVICYGGAAAGSLAAAVVLWKV